MFRITLALAQILSGLRQAGFGLGPTQFTFSIPTAQSTWSGYVAGSEPFSANFGLLSASEANSFRTALALWDRLIAPNFAEVPDNANQRGELRIAYTNMPEAQGGFAYSSSPQSPGSQAGDIWLNYRFAGGDFGPQNFNGYYETLLHEIGHTLGLTHPFELATLDPIYYSQRFTVMGYSQTGNTYTGPGTHITFSGSANRIQFLGGEVQTITPMVLDIAAVQAIYGADPNTEVGDNVYRFDEMSAAVQSIYDAGGIDTLDLSNFTRRVEIDLMPGSYSSLGVFISTDQIAYWSALFPNFRSFITDTINQQANLYDWTNNLGIALSTVIENAVGGSAGDILLGNDAANQLIGNAGDDFLDGGFGIDRLYGGTGSDRYIVDDQQDLIFENSGEGSDMVHSSASFYLYANLEQLTLTGSANIFGVGNELANEIIGNGGENLLIGLGGNDTLRGGGERDALFGGIGDDVLFGDAGVDYMVAGTGNDQLLGGADADEIYGQEGDDFIDGGLTFHTDIMVGGDGNDIIVGASRQGDYDLMYGNLGDDTFLVDTPADLVFEQVGEGIDTVRADINGAGYYLYDNIENLILEGLTPFGVGNASNNSLTGNNIGNYLLGGAGDDRLNGGAGNDVLFGEAGADTFIFTRGTGSDVIGDFQRGSDRIDLSSFGFTSFAQLQARFAQVGDVGAIQLATGDVIILYDVTMSTLTASDFVLGGP